MLADTLVISGGAVKGIAAVGALHYLWMENKLLLIKNYVGTSVGSILAYLLAIGYSPMEIMVDLCQSTLLEEMNSISLLNLMEGPLKGASSFRPIQEHLERLTISRIGKHLTFQGLRDALGKRLVVVTYNASEGQVVYLSPETHPDLPILVGLRMSCGVPIIFDTYEYDGAFWLDGGFGDGFPMAYGVNLSQTHVIGIRLLEDHPKMTHFTNVIEYLRYLFTVPIRTNVHLRLEQLESHETHEIIEVGTNGMSHFNFHLSRSERLDFFSRGFQAAKNYYHHSEAKVKEGDEKEGPNRFCAVPPDLTVEDGSRSSLSQGESTPLSLPTTTGPVSGRSLVQDSTGDSGSGEGDRVCDEPAPLTL